jgi:hypothetical protein
MLIATTLGSPGDQQASEGVRPDGATPNGGGVIIGADGANLLLGRD